ncbi:DUF3108 domain-containing protein [Algibacillus agarilyticus]|uniref:DUF3108 domain-containing protein n=1 Tax=Algibacillus agarilyticus TaxID=2234133 RepID=UPI001E50CD0D|nr:DUF3108 domain-containing protein [Algibacillus agarilyticus]
MSLSINCIAQDKDKKPTIINLDNSAPTALTPFNAKYVVTRGRLTLGNIKRQLTQLDDEKFVFSYMSDLSFLILSDRRKESAEILIKDNKVQPLRYLFRREGTGTDTETTIKFDHVNNKVIDVDLSREIECSTDFHWFDQISYQLQMKIDLKVDQKQYEYYLINDDKKEKIYTFNIIAEEELTVPAGTFKTIKLERERSNKKRITHVWMVPELGNLIVRIRQEKDGSEQADAQLETVTFNAIK